MNRRGFIVNSLALAASAVLAPVVFNTKSQTLLKPKRNTQVLGLRHPVEVELPEGFLFYDVAGQTLFPLYSASGGIRVTSVCYLFRSMSELSRWKGDDFELPQDGSALINYEANGDRWAAIQFTKLVEHIHSGAQHSYETFVKLRIQSVVRDLTSTT